jgi:FMN reductase
MLSILTEPAAGHPSCRAPFQGGSATITEVTTRFRPFIVGIGGTTRAGSSPEKALIYALALAAAQGADTALFDGPSIHLPMYTPDSAERSEDARELISALRRAQGVILATPCYHGSVSGLLKNALDYVEDMARDQHPYFDGRAVGLIVCGHGWQSTAITLSALRSIVHALRGWPTPMGVAINTTPGTHAARTFDDQGAVIEETAVRQIGTMVSQVVEMARMRAQQASLEA